MAYNKEPVNPPGNLREGYAEAWSVVWTNEEGYPTSVFTYPTREKAELHIDQTQSNFGDNFSGFLSLFWTPVQLKNIKIG